MFRALCGLVELVCIILLIGITGYLVYMFRDTPMTAGVWAVVCAEWCLIWVLTEIRDIIKR